MKLKLLLALLVLNGLLFLGALTLRLTYGLAQSHLEVAELQAAVSEEIAHADKLGLPDSKREWYKAALNSTYASSVAMETGFRAVITLIEIGGLTSLANVIGLAICYRGLSARTIRDGGPAAST